MRFKWFVVVFIVLFGTKTVLAREVLQGSDCTVSANQVIEGNVFVLCQTFTLNGTINGDILGAAFNAKINGTINGDIYMLAGQMDVHGRVDQDLIFAGPALRIHPNAAFGAARGDVMSLSLSTEIFDGARVPGSVTSLGYQLNIWGDVDREVSFWGSALTIAGTVDGDVDAVVGDAEISDVSQLQALLVPFRFEVTLRSPGLVVTEDAIINGRLRYSSTSPGVIAGNLEEEPIFSEVVNLPDFSQINELTEDNNVAWLGGYLTVVVREFVTLAVIGLAAAYWLPRPLQAPTQTLRNRPLNSLGTGILAFILSIGIWVVVLLLIILVLLLLAALQLGDLAVVALMILGLLNIGGASAFYFIAIYVSRVIVCLTAGRIIVRFALGDDGSPRMLYLHLLVGIVILSVLVFLPLVGGILNALALALGLGSIILTLTNTRINRRPLAPAHLPTAPQSARQIPPPPVLSEKPQGPGMDNLPSGFEWWDDDESS